MIVRFICDNIAPVLHKDRETSLVPNIGWTIKIDNNSFKVTNVVVNYDSGVVMVIVNIIYINDEIKAELIGEGWTI